MTDRIPLDAGSSRPAMGGEIASDDLVAKHVDALMETAWAMAKCSSTTDRQYWAGELRAALLARLDAAEKAPSPPVEVGGVEPVYHFSARVGKTHEWVGKERLTAAEATISAQAEEIERLKKERDEAREELAEAKNDFDAAEWQHTVNCEVRRGDRYKARVTELEAELAKTREDALEEAARIADMHDHRGDIGAAIRALKEKQP